MANRNSSRTNQLVSRAIRLTINDIACFASTGCDRNFVNCGNVGAREYKFLPRVFFVTGRYQFRIVKMVCMPTFYMLLSVSG
jgi:hypothetical protein